MDTGRWDGHVLDFGDSFDASASWSCGAAPPTTRRRWWRSSMIGFEDEPERSAEICVCEVFGREVGADRALVGMGAHPFADPGIVDDFEKVAVDLDARQPHEYAVEWTPEHVASSSTATRSSGRTSHRRTRCS